MVGSCHGVMGEKESGTSFGVEPLSPIASIFVIFRPRCRTSGTPPTLLYCRLWVLNLLPK